MGEIYSKAKQDKTDKTIRDLLEFIKSIKDDENWRFMVLNRLESIKEEVDAREREIYRQRAWDFSEEKALPVFADDGEITLRPFRETDKEFYLNLHKQWHSDELEEIIELDWDDTQDENSFYCIAEWKGKPIGYIGIIDSGEPKWELASEFDKAWCNKGLGPRCAQLFLRKIEAITMKISFRARVEVDNIACQKAIEKIG